MMTSIIAIVIFGMVLAGTMTFADPIGMMSSVDATDIAQRMQSAAAAVAQVQHDKGSRPTSFAELEDAGFRRQGFVEHGQTFTLRCADERCSPMAICMSMPATSGNVLAARSASLKIRGYLSGACGQVGSSVGDTAVVTLEI